MFTSWVLMAALLGITFQNYTSGIAPLKQGHMGENKTNGGQIKKSTLSTMEDNTAMYERSTNSNSYSQRPMTSLSNIYEEYKIDVVIDTTTTRSTFGQYYRNTRGSQK